ncbi:hypothetical protein HW450_12865 [Corynebacterium hindlerae]|uniref:Uncharacterized protein n=1 Tax=Corynebacterium hindlerae TaxID=699041 RepID=A0A7G5FEZ6_9CORY|nr:hypothetical protein [Corynebacterium hindlerae]QMV85187.1 hypothetical protein HW450_12865 [Corynebacterium hindlerae]
MKLHRIIVSLVAEDSGELTTEVDIEGEPAFVTALGMLDMARQQLYDRVDEDN